MFLPYSYTADFCISNDADHELSIRHDSILLSDCAVLNDVGSVTVNRAYK